MFLKVSMAFVVITPDRGFLESAVHPLNLSVGPGVIDLDYLSAPAPVWHKKSLVEM